MKTLVEKMKPELFEGSQFEMTTDFMVTCCLRWYFSFQVIFEFSKYIYLSPTSSDGLEPYSFAFTNNGRLIAMSLGTREVFPKYYDYKDLAAIRGPYANAYFLALNKAEEDVDESVQGKLKDKKVHIGRALI